MITISALSAAIRKNGYRQAHNDFIRYSYNQGRVLSACALGQAALNMGLDPLSRQSDFERNIEYRAALCPVKSKNCDFRFSQFMISTLIVHLNDDHNWKLDKIADWLDTLAGNE